MNVSPIFITDVTANCCGVDRQLLPFRTSHSETIVFESTRMDTAEASCAGVAFTWGRICEKMIETSEMSRTFSKTSRRMMLPVSIERCFSR